ncbi:MAG: aminoglycoside phosphotransferase family protein, partial [Nanoarchaeota archaeon]|nr:aminoglycoside phosphotransferase family protein [Nanoarchaeota archaeon]
HIEYMFAELTKVLEELGISFYGESIEEYGEGLNSKVYIANSSVGKLIIHIVNCTSEHDLQKIDKKIRLVGAKLQEQNAIPTAQIITAGRLAEGQVFLAQKFIDGTPLGKRDIVKGKIIDTYNVKKPEKYIVQWAQVILKIHSIKCERFGYIDVNIDANSEPLTGKYHSWFEYLETEAKRWLETLRTAEHLGEKYITNHQFGQFKLAINSLLQKNELLFDIKQGSLLHWDIVNPSNVLIKRGKISGIIDFEWCAIGDPLWDLVFSESRLQAKYSELSGIDTETIRKKLLLYHPLWFLWGTNTHLHRPEILNVCLNEFITGMEKARNAGMF